MVPKQVRRGAQTEQKNVPSIGVEFLMSSQRAGGNWGGATQGWVQRTKATRAPLGRRRQPVVAVAVRQGQGQLRLLLRGRVVLLGVGGGSRRTGRPGCPTNPPPFRQLSIPPSAWWKFVSTTNSSWLALRAHGGKKKRRLHRTSTQGMCSISPSTVPAMATNFLK